MATVRDILRESLPLLLAMAVLEVVAGSFLGQMEASLDRLPGLLALVPAVLALRGNISTSMGSRLGTLSRFGVIRQDRWVSAPVWHNLAASIVLGVLLSIAAATLAHVVTLRFGFESAGVLALATIAVTAGLASGLVMGAVAVVTMRVAFRRGLDLDNVAGPVLMTFSDVVTLLSLFVTARLMEGWF